MMRTANMVLLFFVAAVVCTSAYRHKSVRMGTLRCLHNSVVTTFLDVQRKAATPSPPFIKATATSVIYSSGFNPSWRSDSYGCIICSWNDTVMVRDLAELLCHLNSFYHAVMTDDLGQLGHIFPMMSLMWRLPM